MGHVGRTRICRREGRTYPHCRPQHNASYRLNEVTEPEDDSAPLGHVSSKLDEPYASSREGGVFVGIIDL